MRDYLNTQSENDIEANTIDSFQGKECDFVILSTVRTKDTRFTSDLKRINVAITRSKEGLLILGNALCLSKTSIWNKIIEQIASNNGFFKSDKLRKFINKNL